MSVWDDVVNGVKKFGQDVVDGARDGVGKAARIKDTGTIKVNRTKTTGYNVGNIINKAVKEREDIYAKGLKNYDSLNSQSKKMFDEVREQVRTVGNGQMNDDVRNAMRTQIGNDKARQFEKLQRMSPEKRLEAAQKMGINLGGKDLADAKGIDFSDAFHASENSLGRRVGDFTGGGLYGSYNAFKNMEEGKRSIMGALKEGHSVMNDKGEQVLSKKKIAGTATAAMGAASLGNRVFRDEYGELDVPIVPFI